MKFTESLWLSIGNIYGKILKHPFIQGLTDGSLDEESFRFYVIQDALYLRDYARGLALLGAKAPRDQWLMRLSNMHEIRLWLNVPFIRVFSRTGDSVMGMSIRPPWLRTTCFTLPSIVRQVLEVMDQVAQGLKEDDLKVIRHHFVTTSRLEYLFWDMGFHKQGWPV